jgi:hypothetical protein
MDTIKIVSAVTSHDGLWRFGVKQNGSLVTCCFSGIRVHLTSAVSTRLGKDKFFAGAIFDIRSLKPCPELVSIIQATRRHWRRAKYAEARGLGIFAEPMFVLRSVATVARLLFRLSSSFEIPASAEQ